MEEWGNGRANAFFEAELPPNYPRPKEGDPVRTVEKFIRDKYEHKKFIGRAIPPKVVREEEEVEEEEPTVRRRAAKVKPATIVATKVAPNPVSAPVRAPAPVVEAPNLLDFTEPAYETPTVAPPVAPASTPDFFGNFNGAATASVSSNTFGDFSSAMAAPVQQQSTGFGDFGPVK